MQFDTKIAVVIRTDLEPWQKLNVASFLAGGIAAAFPECIGEPYGDGSGTKYLSLIGQPILIYGADRPQLSRALERALAAARKQCKGQCSTVTMKKACAAFAVDMSNPCGAHGYAVKPQISTSLNAATKKCYDFGGKECVIRAWACDAKG